MSLDISPQEFHQLSERIARLATDCLLRLEDGPIQPAVTGARLVETLGARGAFERSGSGRRSSITA